MPYSAGVWRPHGWEDWEIELIDGSLNTLGSLDEAVKCVFPWALFGYGAGSFSLHINSQLATDLIAAEMFYVKAYRNGEWIHDFMVAKDDRGVVANRLMDDYIEISLSPLEAILKDKTCYPDGGTGTFETPNLSIDDGFKWIVDHACGPNAYTGPGASVRVLPNLTIAAATSDHPTVMVQDECHKQDVFAFLQRAGARYGTDWFVWLESTGGIAHQFVFDTSYPLPGLDKTIGNGARMPVIFNDASGEMPSAHKYRPATGFINVAIGKSLTTERTNAASIAIYGRRELLADTDEADKLDSLLVERGQKIGSEIEFAESEMMEAGVAVWQARPGDEVTTANQQLELAAEDEYVQSITFELDDSGNETPTLVFGTYEKDLLDKIQESGGGGGGGYYWPIRGLFDDADVFVPENDADDYIGVKLDTDAYLSATADIPNNLIKLEMVDVLPHNILSDAHADTAGNIAAIRGGLMTGQGVAPKWMHLAVGAIGESVITADGVEVSWGAPNPAAHDIVGALHTVAGAIYQVVGLTAANVIGLLTPTVVSAANSLVRTDASGYIRATRLELGGATSYIDGAGASFPAMYAATRLQLGANGHYVRFTSTEFYPHVTNDLDLGTNTFKWKDGYFAGDVLALGGFYFDANNYFDEPAANRVRLNGRSFVDLSANAVTQIRLQGGIFFPIVTNTVDLGTNALRFKNGYFIGNVYLTGLSIAAYGFFTGDWTTAGFGAGGRGWGTVWDDILKSNIVGYFELTGHKHPTQ